MDLGQFSVMSLFPTAISAPDGPFKEAINLKLNGKYGHEIYRDIIQPAIEREGFLISRD